MHTLLHLKLFTILQNPKCCGGFAAWSFSRRAAVRLVDPRQLLHDLNDLVHGGLALHAAAVVDLERGDRECWEGDTGAAANIDDMRESFPSTRW